MLQKKIAEVIRNLKRVRQENGLTISEIANLCEKNGEAVSETTIKKVFSDGSETFGFNYEATLKNSSVKIEISNYLLGIFITEFNQSDFGTDIYNWSADSSFMENIDIIVRIKDTYKYVTMDSDKTTAENYEFSFEDVKVEEGDNIEITFRYFGFDGRWHYYNHTLTIN